MNDVIHGDCLDVMATFEPESIDAIVTDPPYLLRFMGKAWDSPTAMSGHATPDAGTVGFYQAIGKGGGHDGGLDNWRPNQMQDWHERWAREAFRVAKPGAHLLAFGGTRTYHRLACAIEDAGWEIRDCLVWAYGTGFPKSSRVNRDAAFCQCGATGRSGESTSRAPEMDGRIRTEEPLARAADAARSDGYATREALGSPDDYLPAGRSGDGLPRLGEALDLGFAPSREDVRARSHSGEPAGDPTVGSSRSLSPAPRSALLSSRDYPNPDGALASTPTGTTGSTERGSSIGSDIDSQAGRTVRRDDALAAWPHCTTCGKPNADGLGTALKPAWEPIVLARKPLRGTVAANVQAFGTGALNIDGTRIGGPDGFGGGAKATSGFVDGYEHDGFAVTGLGRWPANVILTDPIFDGGIEGVVGGGASESGISVRRNGVSNDEAVASFTQGFAVGSPDAGYTDTGTYSRFFIIPKSSRTDREPVLDEYAYRLHRERGDCGKLSAWGSEGRNRSEPTGSTSLGRAISEGTPSDDSSSAMSQSGSPLPGRSRPATNSTTSTATSRTTDSSTSSSSIPSPISASIPAASSKMVSGGSPVASVASESLWEAPTGISVPRAGRSTGGADPATSRSWSSRNVCADCGKPLPRFSTHPTQKPTDLMRHLVRLVTPPGGTVLDPFLGSGSTAIAAELEGFPWIGIEKEAEYVEIARARLNGTQRGLGLVGA